MVGSCPTGMDGAHGYEHRANSFAVQSPIPCVHETGKCTCTRGTDSPSGRPSSASRTLCPSNDPMKTADFGAKANQTAASESGTQQWPPASDYWVARTSRRISQLWHPRTCPSPTQHQRATATIVCISQRRIAGSRLGTRALDANSHLPIVLPRTAPFISTARITHPSAGDGRFTAAELPRGIALESQCAGTRSSTASASSPRHLGRPRRRGGTVQAGDAYNLA